jgi:hypothetical protein
MKCPKCEAKTYTSIGGKEICPQCGYGAAHYIPPQPERQTQRIEASVEIPPERRAFREAGHVVMAYLILKAGWLDFIFAIPIAAVDRPYLVPPFMHVTLEGAGVDWGEISFSLRSLITTPVILLAGFAAERLKDGISDAVLPASSPLTGQALGLLAAYEEEYGEEDTRERDRRAARVLVAYFELAEAAMLWHWKSIEALAQALLQSKTLSAEAAYAVVERHLPNSTQARIKALAS